MGQRIIHFSDLSGKEMPEGERPAQMILVPADKRKGVYRLEITEEEFNDFRDKGEKTDADTIKSLGLVA